MSASLEAVTEVMGAIPLLHKAALMRTTPELFPFANIEVGREVTTVYGNTERRVVDLRVAIHVLNGDYAELFGHCDTVEAALESVLGLEFKGYAAVLSSFELEVSFLTREMNYTYTKLIC
jgi:hypothetical protein